MNTVAVIVSILVAIIGAVCAVISREKRAYERGANDARIELERASAKTRDSAHRQHIDMLRGAMQREVELVRSLADVTRQTIGRADAESAADRPIPGELDDGA